MTTIDYPFDPSAIDALVIDAARCAAWSGEAIAVSSATRFGLAAGIYTRDGGGAMGFPRDVLAGQVFIKGYLDGGGAIPFGGMKESGFGREKGMAALRDYCEVKAVTTSF